MSNQSRSIPWQTVMALVAAAAAAIFVFVPLTSSRPDSSALYTESTSLQNVQARLWQDPFHAAFERQRADRDQLAATADYAVSLTLPGGEHRSLSASLKRDTIEAHLGAKAARAARLKKLTNLLAARKDVRVLAVMQHAGPYAELAEQRLRARVAVVEALATQGLQPADNEHIGYVEIDCAPTPDEAGDGAACQRDDIFLGGDPAAATTLVVPFEWFEHASIPMPDPTPKRPATRPAAVAASVLVIWLQEEKFDDYPLIRLAYLSNRLYGGSLPTTPLTVIGPRVSTTLRKMVEEARESAGSTAAEVQEWLAAMEIYSPTASASDEALLLGTGQRSSVHDYVREKAGVYLKRTAHDDDELCEEIVKELGRRHIYIKPSATISLAHDSRRSDDVADIAIVSEWDTFYGRSLPYSLAAQVTGRRLDELVAQPSRFPEWIHTSFYLRGIDGKLPAESGRSASRSLGPGEAGARQSARLSAPTEKPEGLDQADYLRRLAADLVSLDSRLRAGGRQLKAVGVLGTDVYDKLLVMRALRDRLPGVLFFTTGVDARYALPSEWNAAHNLTIVSSYGLRLRGRFQGGVPPFRDSNQAALFHAVTQVIQPDMSVGAPEKPSSTSPATTGSAAGTSDGLVKGGRRAPESFGVPTGGVVATGMPKVISPRVFEIGRNGPRDLSDDSSPQGGTSPHPSRLDGRLPQNVSWLGWAGFSLAGAFAWGITYGERPRKLSLRKFVSSTPVFLTWIIPTLVLVVLLAVWRDGRVGEPFAFLDGISVWPTEFLRMLAVALCVHYVFKARAEIAENDRELASIFKLRSLDEVAKAAVPEPGELKPTSLTPTALVGRWKVYGKTEKEEAYEEPADNTYKVFAANLWWEYCRRAGFGPRVLRTTVYAVLFSLFSIAIVLAYGAPIPPIRGDAAWMLDRIISISTLLASSFLLFFALDGAYLNSKFIGYLVRTDTHWPVGAAEQFKRLNLAPQELTEYLDVRFVAVRTKVVGKFVYLPFIVYLLIYVSRTRLFDNWGWPIGVAIVVAVNLALAAVGAWLLRKAAERVREDALAKLRDRQLGHIAGKRPEQASAIKDLIERVRDERDGAFSILSQYPTLAALVVPGGGLGVWVLLEYLAQAQR